MPDTSSLLVACPHCGKKLEYRRENEGRRAACPACNRQFRLPLPDPRDDIGFDCLHCGTRLSAPRNAIGRRIECPDCRTRTPVPEPPPPPKPRRPAALDGPQYELWGVDEAPLPADLLKQQQPRYRVACRRCSTEMDALPEELGSELVCPDCGTTTIASAGRSTAASTREAAAGGRRDEVDDIQLDASSAPTPRPTAHLTALLDREQREVDRQRQEAQKRTAEARLRPPRLPLVTRVLAMLATSTVIGWWVGLSAMLFVVGVFAQPAVAGDAALGGFGAIYTICFLVVAVILGSLWLGAAGAFWLAIITESADGHDRLHDPPTTDFVSWFDGAIYIVVAGSISLAPGSGIHAALVAADLPASQWTVVGAWLLVFPLVLLSALEGCSPWAVVSPRLFATLTRCPIVWLFFYVETALLGVGVVGALAGMLTRPPWGPALAAPAAVGASLLYARLIGRLAWWLAEATSEFDITESESSRRS